MTMKADYLAYLERRKAKFDAPMGGLWKTQTDRYLKPFQIFGNLYYVGDDWVCVHLVDTGDGLLLIDAGNCGATSMLIHAIWSLGFNPANVKWMVLSHAHVDHIGGANFFKNMFGTKIYLGEADAKAFESAPELALIHESTDYADALFTVDEVICDGDTKQFGNTTMQFATVPGHTIGTIAVFFDVTDGKTVLRAGTFGGFGFNTLQKDFLLEIGDPNFEMRKLFLNSLAKVRQERVDIFVANHTVNNGLVAKAARLQKDANDNAFIDSAIWGQYLDEKRDALIAFCANPKNN